MPITHETVLFDVKDCKVYSMTADTGASPTYGAAVDVPGIAQFGVNPDFATAILKGDGGKTLASKGKVPQVNASLTYGKVALDVLETVIDSAVTDSGSTPNQKATWRLLGSNKTIYFKVEVLIDDVEVGLGGVRVIFYKASLTGGGFLGQQTDQFGQPTLEIAGIAADSNDYMLDIVIDETLTQLSA